MKEKKENYVVKRTVPPVLITRHAMEMCEGVEVQLLVLLISGPGQVHASTALPLRKSYQNWRLDGPQITFLERKYPFP